MVCPELDDLGQYHRPCYDRFGRDLSGGGRKKKGEKRGLGYYCPPSLAIARVGSPSQGLVPIMSAKRPLAIPAARARVLLGWWL